MFILAFLVMYGSGAMTNANQNILNFSKKNDDLRKYKAERLFLKALIKVNSILLRLLFWQEYYVVRYPSSI